MTEEKKFYTCKYDRAFKEVFMKEENQDILKKLLESILKVEISKIEYLNVERNSGNVYIKGKRFDLYLNTNVGKIQVEVNSEVSQYIHPRNMGYICNSYASYVLKGNEYTEEIKIIQINLSYGLKDKEKIRVYQMRDKEDKLYVENLYIYEINMEKYKEIWYSKDEKEIEEHKYLIMLDLEKEELVKLSSKNKEIERYMEEIKRVNEDPEFYEYMSAEEDARKIENSRLREFRETMEKERQAITKEKQAITKEKQVITKEKENILKEGREEGLEQGLEQGSIQKALEIAKAMIRKGMDKRLVLELTGLTQNEVESLEI